MTESSLPQDVISSDPHRDYLWQRRGDFLYRIRLNALYHAKRERFFDRVDKTLSMATAVSATGAVMAILKQVEQVDLAVSALTAVMSLIPLVVNPAERARKSGQKAASFRRLRARAVSSGEDWSSALNDQFMAESLELEVDDEAPLAAVVADCENQISIAEGKEALVYLTFWQRLTMHLWDFDAAKLHGQRAPER